MNKSKGTVFIIVVAMLVAVGIVFAISRLKPPPQPQPPKNPFIQKVQTDIDNLEAKPDNKFYKNQYDDILHEIRSFHQDNLFSDDQKLNDQYKEDFEKQLFTVYVNKFINSSKNVFKGHIWSPADLKFIQSEKKELEKSGFLVPGSSVDKDLTTIQNALNKYHEIEEFVSQCRSFNFTKTNLEDKFPVSEVETKIDRAKSYLNNHLENRYVNNCRQLHNELKEVPQILFNAHIRYLDNKINHWSGMYSNYSSQADYANNLYKPLKAEIDILDNNIYDVEDLDTQYNRLIAKLNDDSDKAYNFFSNN